MSEPALGGHHAAELLRRARGESDSPLRPTRTPKSISDETTFAHDEADRRVLWEILRSQAAECAARLRARQLVARQVGVKLRYADFQTVGRHLTLAEATDDPAVLAAAVAALMRRAWQPTPRPLRLIGVRVAGLQPRAVWEQLRLGW